MTGMLDLAKVHEFVDHRFDQRALFQDGFIEVRAGNRFHVLADLGDEVDAAFAKEISQPFRQRQARLPMAMCFAIRDQSRSQGRFKFLAEIAHQTVQLRKIVHERLLVLRSIGSGNQIFQEQRAAHPFIFNG
jgi:hypothetical protein